MQEGTFWMTDLWRAVGGLREDLLYAGDFDLWRRMSEHVEFVSVDNVLAVHRRHHAQLTNSLDRYLAELDVALGDAGLKVRDEAWAEFVDSGWQRVLAEEKGYLGTLARYNIATRRWDFLSTPVLPRSATVLKEVLTPGGSLKSLPLLPRNGFGAYEGPYDQWNLPSYVRWANASRCSFELPEPVEGHLELFLVCRNLPRPMSAHFVSERGEQSASVVIPGTTDPRDFLVQTSMVLEGPAQRLELVMAGGEPRETWILFVNGWVTMKKSLSATELPGILQRLVRRL